jgi:hypothetical protein
MSAYRIYETRGYFYIDCKNTRIGRLYDTVEEAKKFIEEHKKSKEFNISQIKSS